MISRAKRWSALVTQGSDALTFDEGVVTRRDTRGIAQSLKPPAERCTRRESAPSRSAMSLPSFCINRMSTRLAGEWRNGLERAKVELRALFGRNAGRRHSGAAK